MTRPHALALAGLGLACVHALAAPASASPPSPDWYPDEHVVIAGDPPPPPPAPPPPKPVPGESTIVLASGAYAWTSDDGGVRELGPGGALSFVHVERRGDFPTGVEVSGFFLHGDDASVYDLSIRLIGSTKLGREPIAPFVAIGLCAGATRIVDAQAKASGEDVSYGLALGPSAAIGLHGFLNDTLYWRAGAGVLAAGVPAVTADLGIGVVLD